MVAVRGTSPDTWGARFGSYPGEWISAISHTLIQAGQGANTRSKGGISICRITFFSNLHLIFKRAAVVGELPIIQWFQFRHLLFYILARHVVRTVTWARNNISIRAKLLIENPLYCSRSCKPVAGCAAFGGGGRGFPIHGSRLWANSDL